jgi:hypothetical protein
LYGIAGRLGRSIRSDQQYRVESVSRYLEGLRGDGLKLATTVSGAAELVTQLYKGELPLSGTVDGFPVRKEWARETASYVYEHVELISPNAEHFRVALALWYTYCQRGIREAYAQFGDYVDSAMIQDPPEERVIQQIAVGHPHIPYILKKCGSTQLIHFL